MLKEPVGRQLQLQEEGYTAIDNSKQQGEISSNSNSSNLQVLEIHGKLTKSKKLRNFEEEVVEIAAEDNNGMEKVTIYFYSILTLKKF